MKAGIVLDTQKLPIFERRLTEAGFEFEKVGNFTKDGKTYTLTVVTDELEGLAKVLQAANNEARDSTEGR